MNKLEEAIAELRRKRREKETQRAANNPVNRLKEEVKQLKQQINGYKLYITKIKKEKGIKEVEGELDEANRTIEALARELDSLKDLHENAADALNTVKDYVRIAIEICDRDGIETHIEYGRYSMAKEIDAVIHGRSPSEWYRRKKK